MSIIKTISDDHFPRLPSLDVFRGITIMIMIVVNSPGNRLSFQMLNHSAWNGCTLADLVFPFFIFIVGASSVLALAKQRMKGVSRHFLIWKIIKRTLFLFSIGLLLNAISAHIGWSTLRVLGVLQRIAICYFFTSLLYLTTTIRTQALILVGLLLAYWLIMTCGENQLSMTNNFAAYVDQLVIPARHLYTNTFDPEGLLSTFPAIATALLGNLSGVWLLSANNPSKKLTGLIIAGIITGIAGWIWGLVFPINKSLWTSSYVLWTGGLAMVTFAFCYWAIEIKGWKKWSRPFEIVGMSALLVYFLHILFLKIQGMILIPVSDNVAINLRLFITQTLFPVSDLKMASLLYALSYMLCWFLLIIVSQQIKSYFKKKNAYKKAPSE